MRCVDRTQVDEKFAYKIRKCVPTKRNRETNGAFQKHFSTESLLRRTHRLHDFAFSKVFMRYIRYALTRPLKTLTLTTVDSLRSEHYRALKKVAVSRTVRLQECPLAESGLQITLISRVVWLVDNPPINH